MKGWESQKWEINGVNYETDNIDITLSEELAAKAVFIQSRPAETGSLNSDILYLTISPNLVKDNLNIGMDTSENVK